LARVDAAAEVVGWVAVARGVVGVIRSCPALVAADESVLPLRCQRTRPIAGPRRPVYSLLRGAGCKVRSRDAVQVAAVR